MGLLGVPDEHVTGARRAGVEAEANHLRQPAVLVQEVDVREVVHVDEGVQLLGLAKGFSLSGCRRASSRQGST